MEKSEIIKNLEDLRGDIESMITGLTELDTTDDTTTNRKLVNTVTFALFHLVDSLVNTEADIYNYFHRRDRN